MVQEVKRWTACWKSILVLKNLQGRTTFSEASQLFDLPPHPECEIDSQMDQVQAKMEDALKAQLGYLREQSETPFKALQEVYGEEV
jgi:hypothetical protein